MVFRLLSLYLQFLFASLQLKRIDIDNMWTELSDTAILNKLGKRLKAYRISRGLKQQELASESGVGVSTIANGTVEDARQAGKARKNNEGVNYERNTSYTNLFVEQPCGSYVVG